MKIKVLFVRYDRIKYPNSLDIAYSICSSFLHGINVEFLVIDNAVGGDTRWVERDIECISGDNTYFEFSAWDRGISDTDLENIDGIIFITDAFTRSHQNYIKCFDNFIIDQAINGMAALGHIDMLPEPIMLNGNIGREWMRTAFFFLPASFVKIMGKMQNYAKKEIIFSSDYKKPFLENGYLSDNFKDYLVGWVTGCGKKGWVDHKWHSEFQVTPESFDFFKKKVHTIILERALTFKIIQMGYCIYDVEFLNMKKLDDNLLWNRKSMEYQSLYLLWVANNVI